MRTRDLRAFVALDSGLTRCVIFDSDNAVKYRFRAFGVNLARKVDTRQLRYWKTDPYRGPRTREHHIALEVRDSLDKGPCCYAMYCHATRQVKIGRTTNLFRRWSTLETQGGRPLQLLAVWHTSTPATAERLLHDRFTEHRTRGEWFTADPVIGWLCELTQAGARLPRLRVPYENTRTQSR